MKFFNIFSILSHLKKKKRKKEFVLISLNIYPNVIEFRKFNENTMEIRRNSEIISTFTFTNS